MEAGAQTLAEFVAMRDREAAERADLIELMVSGRAKELRKAVRMSYREMSERYDIPVATLHHWENAVAMPTFSPAMGRYLAALREIDALVASQ